MRELALILLLSSLSISVVDALKEKVPCIENGKFYRNPNRHPDYVWSQTECAKYYLCIEDEVQIETVSHSVCFIQDREVSKLFAIARCLSITILGVTTEY